MNDVYSEMAANAIAHEAFMARLSIVESFYGFTRPSVLFRPTIKRDGDVWCALLGDNLQEGISGFGKSPAEAADAFDRSWLEEINNEE